MCIRPMETWQQTYHINTPRLLVIPGLWLGIVAVLLVMAAQPSERGHAIAWLQAAGLLTLILLPFFLITWRSRLVLTDLGITHYQFGYTVQSTWANVESLSMAPGVEGLYLREPGTHSKLLRVSTQILDLLTRAVGWPSFIGDAQALAEGRFIALITFTNSWHHGPLIQDLQRWAPQLFPKLDA